MTDRQFDFAIVGAGMAGASLAAELAPHGSVILLEAEDAPGYHSTGRSAAFWEECYGGPGIVPLTLASGGYLRKNGFLSRRGGLYIGRAEDRAKLDAFEERFAGTGVTIERLSAARLHDLVPRLRPEWCDAISQAGCADIDVAGLHQHYLKTVKRAGARLVCRARVTEAERKAGAWHIATERGETYRAATLVNAAGAWADSLAQLAGARPLGIAPKRRTMVQLRVDPVTPPDLPLTLDISGRFYFKSDGGRLWLSPHDEIPSEPTDAAPEDIDVARVIDRLQGVADWRIEGVERRWAGLRSFAPDRLPVYGRDPEVEGFAWFAGQGGFGIQTAPAAARLMAQLLLGHDRDEMTGAIDPSTYSPARFGGSGARATG